MEKGIACSWCGNSGGLARFAGWPSLSMAAWRNLLRTRSIRGAVGVRCLGYTFGMDLILKLVAGLMAGLRAYFLLAAAAVAIPCVVFFVVFLVGLSRPSRAKLAGPPRHGNQ